jgi:hypothetical protein
MLVTASAPVCVPISFPTPYHGNYDTIYAGAIDFHRFMVRDRFLLVRVGYLTSVA